jgi:hypothetical protein
MDCPRSAVRMVVMAFVSDDHNAEAGEAAVREIVADVVLLNGTQGVQDLAVELGDKLAQLVSCAGNSQGKSRLLVWLEQGGRRPWWS